MAHCGSSEVLIVGGVACKEPVTHFICDLAAVHGSCLGNSSICLSVSYKCGA